MSQRSNGRSASRALSTLVVSAVAGSALLATAPASAATVPASPTITTETVTVVPSDDAYLDSAAPNRNTGSAVKVVASKVGTASKTALFKFKVPAAPEFGVLSGAKLQLTADRNLPARVDLRRLSSTSWTEGTVTVKTGVKATDTLASIAPASGSKSLSYNVQQLLTPGTTRAFGVTTPAGTAELISKEAAAGRPRLVLTYTVTTPAPIAKTVVRIGMSSPAGQWDTRLAETGGVDSRRIFDDLATPDFGISLAKSETAAGRMPILSFKIPSNDWAGVGQGTYDAQLKSLATELAAVPGPVFVTLHHEPSGDGTPTNYASMMRQALPILGAPANVDAGPIVNGFWWSNGPQGLSDAEIAQWLPADVLSVSEVVAADTYHGGTAEQPGEHAGVKITRLSEWADRVGVKRLGIGEYNGLNAAAITAAGDAILADPRFAFAAIFNSSVNNREGIDWTLTGDRLAAFQATVQQSRAARTAS